LFIFLLISLSVASVFYSLKLCEKDNFPEFLLIFLIIFYSQILCFSMVLGFFHILNLKFLFFFSLVSVIISILKYKKETIKIFLTSSFSNFNIIIFSLVFSFYFFACIQLSFLLPPLATDGLLYHLPFAVHFLKTSSISLCPLYFGDIAMSYYPFGGEIFYFFTLLSQKEFLLKFTQLPFLIMGAISVFLISKELSLSNISSLLTSLIFAMTKPVFKEASLCFVDLMMASTFLASLYFLLKDKKKYIILAILSCTILISIKTLSLIYFVFLIPFFFKKRDGKYIKKDMFFSLVYFFLFGFFSYIRNFILTKNPFYPANISIGKFTIFPGLYIYKKTLSINCFKILLSPQSHIDPSFFIISIMFLFLFISIFIYCIEKRKFPYLFFLPFFIILGYFILIPPNYYQIRHLLPIYGICAIAFVYPFKKKQLQYLPFLFLFYFFCLLFPYNHQNVYLFLIIFTIFTISFYLIKKFPIFNFIFFFFFFLYLSIYLFPVATFSYNKVKFKIWGTFYKDWADAWEFVGKSKNKNISYVGGFLLYPFFGENYSNNLYYQSVNSVETYPVHFYKGQIIFSEENPEKIYRKDPSFNLWFMGLKKKKIDWIVLKKDECYIEKEWIEKNPQYFKLIFSGKITEIYNFLY